jgi:hypothetical protein
MFCSKLSTNLTNTQLSNGSARSRYFSSEILRAILRISSQLLLDTFSTGEKSWLGSCSTTKKSRNNRDKIGKRLWRREYNIGIWEWGAALGSKSKSQKGWFRSWLRRWWEN